MPIRKEELLVECWKCEMQDEPNLTFKQSWSADSINQFERALQRNMSSLSACGIESNVERMATQFHIRFRGRRAALTVLKPSENGSVRGWLTLHLLQRQKAMYRRVVRSGIEVTEWLCNSTEHCKINTTISIDKVGLCTFVSTSLNTGTLQDLYGKQKPHYRSTTAATSSLL